MTILKDPLSVLSLLVIGALSVPAIAADPAAPVPNVLWISSEDHGPEMGCYGDPHAVTPNVDELAQRGLRYKTCWSNAPVCAPARTTIITGMYPQSLGAEHMRSMVEMPQGTRLFPSILRDRGYYCTNNSKEDYNVRSTETVWDASSPRAHYKTRANDQPFFAVFNSTASHESAIRRFSGTPTHDPDQIRVPAYHPDTETSRRDWAIYYDSVTAADAEAGKHLRELEEAGLVDSTIVFYWGDHGSGMPRSKRWPCNSGLHVPLIVYIPEAFAHLRPPEYAAGGVSERLVGFVDFAPTVLSLAGIEPPTWMQGHAFLGSNISSPQPYVYGFRGRMDERLDLVRSATDGRFSYLRNFMPHRSQGQHVAYQFETATTAQWRDMFEAGELNAAQSIFWQTPKAPEELYDLTADPDEINNLANDPAWHDQLVAMREAVEKQSSRIIDLGFIPEGMRFDLAGDQPFYDWARQPGNYNYAKVFAAADMASRTTQYSTEKMLPLVADPDPVVRYWGTLGILMRGEAAVASSIDELTKALDDPSVYVALAAARSLVSYGNPAQQRTVAEFLLERADWSRNNVFVAMMALEALNSVHAKLDAFATKIADLPNRGPAPDNRYDSYVPRLIESLRTGAY
jgi:uncharacterized sulfatase